MTSPFRLEFVRPTDAAALATCRAACLDACRAAGRAPAWQEYVAGSAVVPGFMRRAPAGQLYVNGFAVATTAAAVEAQIRRVTSGRGHRHVRLAFSSGWAAAQALALLVLPKCPLCLAAYLSVVGVGSGVAAPLFAWLLPVAGGFALLSVSLLWRGAARRNGYAPGLTAVAGAGVLIGYAAGYLPMAAGVGGLGVLLLAAAWNSLPPGIGRFHWRARRPARAGQSGAAALTPVTTS